jgi:CDP-diglyceride synthetase
VEMIFSILLSFLVLLAYSEMIYIKLSAVYYKFGIMLNFVCKILPTLRTACFVFLYIYDSLHVIQSHCLSLVLLLRLLTQNTVAVTSAYNYVLHCNERIFMILCNFSFSQSLVLQTKHHFF